jgi:ABC-type Na+ efflux pump permease subunit
VKRALAAFASIALLAWLAFHVWVIVHLVQSEVLPALAAGSFNIRTNSMILNRVWEGNELYWLLAAHATLVLVLAGAFTLSARFAIVGRRRPKAAA